MLALFDAEQAGRPAYGNALARDLGVSPGAITYAKRILVNVGWLAQDPPDPGRRRRLNLSPTGRAAAEELRSQCAQTP